MRMNSDSWICLTILAPVPAIDLLCQELTTLGCAGTMVENRDLDTFTVPTDELDPTQDISLQAYFEPIPSPQKLNGMVEQTLAELQPLFPGRKFQLEGSSLIRQEDWAEGWKQHFSTQKIGKRLIIKPSWEEYNALPDQEVIELDPGMAFGTGTHGTTMLCLEAIVALFDKVEPPQSLLDVGTGSGILAMAAAALGAKTILACDIDPVACDVARDNCNKNELSDRIEITAETLENLPGRYDIVVANILAEENLRLAEDLFKHLNPGGYLFLSGILAEKEQMVRAGFSALPLRFIETTRQEEWVCLSWQRT